jgi:hypothetical protein
MKTRHVTIPALVSALALSLALGGPAIGQTTTPSETKPPPTSPQTGTTPSKPSTSADAEKDKAMVPEGAVARANALIGTTVRNSAGDKVGTVDDLLMGSDSKVNYAVLSVGGFLGIGDRLVAVPMSDLQMASDHMVMPSATKETLQKMPKFDRSAVYYPGYTKDVPRATPGGTGGTGGATTPPRKTE